MGSSREMLPADKHNFSNVFYWDIYDTKMQ